MRLLRLSVSFGLVGLAVAAGCGSSASSEAGGAGVGGATLASGGSSAKGGSAGGAGASAASGAGLGGASAGGATSGCPSGCAATEKCSTSGTCIPKDGCATSADCGAGTVCEPTGKCVPGGGCGAQKITADAVPSNLIVVLDRSCSMTQKLANGKSKWEMAVSAISQMTTQFATQIRFGLSMFPTKVGDKCGVAGPIAIPIGDGNGPKIAALLKASLATTDPNFPSGPCATPIDAGLKTAATDPALVDGVHPSFAMLLTDGEQSTTCSMAGGAMGATAEISALAKKNVPTFVVGFGGQVNVAQLDAFATAGGKPASATSPKFYKAEDEPSLQKALQTIAGQAIGCSFALGTKPPDPSMLYTFFDKKDVPRDPTHAAGWDYDAAKNQVTVYGSYCDALKAGTVKVVDIVFGCDMAPPPG